MGDLRLPHFNMQGEKGYKVECLKCHREENFKTMEEVENHICPCEKKESDN